MLEALTKRQPSGHVGKLLTTLPPPPLLSLALDPNVLRMLGEPGQFPPIRIPALLKSEPVSELASSKKRKPSEARAKCTSLAAVAPQPAKRQTCGEPTGLETMSFDGMG